MVCIDLVLALTRHDGARLAEVGFLLIVLAGVWLIVAVEIPALADTRARTLGAGVLFAISGVLLLVATHWGHFR